MDTILQIWGGVGYLLNKIFLSRAEGKGDGRTWRICGWTSYLIGLPAWVIILISKHDWIAAAIEAGGAPAMFFGLIAAFKSLKDAPPRLKSTAKWFVRIFLTIGVAYSVYDYGGLTKWSQGLEIACMFGFLCGTYLLAQNNPRGWYWFMLMNTSMGLLMFMQDKSILAVQQAVSLGFVISGLIRSKRTNE